MKKLPLVLALAAASVCTFAHAQSSVSINVKLYPYLNYEEASGATAAGIAGATLAGPAAGPSVISGGVKGMASGNSYLSFRGTEQLGGGLKASFQIEGTVAVDDGNATSAFSWNRNTFVGLDGGFGSVKLGLMDTVFKEYGDTLGVLSISSGTPMSTSNILRKVSFGTNNAARFHERRANSIRYDSPQFGGGFEAALQFATQEDPNAVTGIGERKTWSGGLKYDKDEWYFAIAHEIHDNWFGGSTNSPSAMRNNAQVGVTSKDTATQATVEWRFSKQHKVEFDVIQKEYKETANVAGRFLSYKNTAYMVAMDSRWNPQWRTSLQYVKADAGSCARVAAVCSTSGLEGSKVLAGAAYYFSRRTFAFVVLDKMTNGASGRYAANDFGAVNHGEDTQHFIMGLHTAF